MQNTIGSSIHAYLHIIEGDSFNASFWYRQAGLSFPKETLEEELEHLIKKVVAEN